MVYNESFTLPLLIKIMRNKHKTILNPFNFKNVNKAHGIILYICLLIESKNTYKQMRTLSTLLFVAAFAFLNLISSEGYSQLNVTVNHEIEHQTMHGFGASLAFYENWLIAHPNKQEIYDAVFGELGLDILRVRNAYDYDAGMINRVKEFITASEQVRGTPIPFLSTSWGPPAYLKSNNDRSNGGTLKYTVDENGNVTFDYEGFAEWWDASLNHYEANGVYPTYVSIQNEPDYTATWESCRFHPFERVNAEDTIAGYNKALEAFHAKISQREHIPQILGPEPIGVGYNSLRNYLLHLDKSLIDGVAFHLYHGVDPDNPWATSEIKTAGNLAPELPYHQTEYERSDWFNISGLIYKSLVDANVVSYYYWDLIWENGGLVSLDFPWDRNRWSNTKGYTKTKKYYAFMQFSAFVHKGWKRVETTLPNTDVSAVSFINPSGDTTSVVIINRSIQNEREVAINFENFNYDISNIYQTSENTDCDLLGELDASTLTVPKRSITTIQFVDTTTSNNVNALKKDQVKSSFYPNPLNKTATISFSLPDSDQLSLVVFNSNGKIARKEIINNEANSNQYTFHRNGLNNGLYLYRIENKNGISHSGRFIISD